MATSRKKPTTAKTSTPARRSGTLTSPSKSRSKTQARKSSPQGGAPGWLAPTAIGAGVLLGVGLWARRASAASHSTTNNSTTDNSINDHSINDHSSSDHSTNDHSTNDSSTNDSSTNDSSNNNSSNNNSSNDIVFPIRDGQEGARTLQDLCRSAGLDADWVRFFSATARGESGFTSNVVLGERNLYPIGSKPSAETERLGAGEARGARIAYDRAVAANRLDGCPWPASAYTWGGGGWLGMLPANAWHAYTNTSLRCRHPWYLLHPVDHVIVAIEFARRLRGWSAFKANPTWLTLRVGWGNPSAMGDPQRLEAMAKKWAPHLQALNIPQSWMHKKVTALPSGGVEERWERLMEISGMDPGKKAG